VRKVESIVSRRSAEEGGSELQAAPIASAAEAARAEAARAARKAALGGA